MATPSEIYWNLFDKNLEKIQKIYRYTDMELIDLVMYINNLERELRLEKCIGTSKLEITYFCINNYFETFDWNLADLKKNITKNFIEHCCPWKS